MAYLFGWLPTIWPSHLNSNIPSSVFLYRLCPDTCRTPSLLLHALAPMDIKPRCGVTTLEWHSPEWHHTTWNHSPAWRLRDDDIHQRGAWYTWATGENRCSQRSWRISLVVVTANEANILLGLECRTSSVKVFPGELWQLFISKDKERKMITHQGTRRPL